MSPTFGSPWRTVRPALFIVAAVGGLIFGAGQVGGTSAVFVDVERTPEMSVAAGQWATTPAIPAECAGMEFDETIVGTNGDDVLVAGNHRSLVFGLGGNDTLRGNQQNDCLDGGGGDDVLEGGNGKDVLIGGPANDQLTGGNGKDRLYGGAGDDVLIGGNSPDTLNGGEGTDTCDSGHAPDTEVNCEVLP